METEARKRKMLQVKKKVHRRDRERFRKSKSEMPAVGEGRENA